MRAAILKETKGKLEIQDRPIPTPGHGEVLIRVHACGVCHGDLMVRNGDFPFVQLPIVLGHEIAGVVENLGPGVDHLQQGTRVGVPWLHSACGHCKQCIVGDEILCANGQYVGMTRDGALVMRRQRIMGSPAGSRKELRAALDLAAARGIRSHSRRFPLDEANGALDELETAHPAGRLILQMDH